jgi:hypothetical protein
MRPIVFYNKVAKLRGVPMTANINGEMAGGVDTIAVSESAKRQIGLQASESKANSADPRLSGTSFLDSFSLTTPAIKK